MKKIKARIKPDLIVYGILTAFAAVMLFPSLDLGLGEKGNLGPGLLPFIASICILVTGSTLGISSLLKKARAGPSPENDVLGRKEWLQAAGILFIFSLWPLLVGFAGYIWPTLLVSFGLAKAVGYKSWKQPVIFSVLITAFIWLIFGVLFHLDLPSGFSF
ncbi:MAG: tripartite tricarboxylate transporter TctB family protein [Thermodesulfobacteriota bacterium]